MRILLYKGKSLISRSIRFQTRSPYSHAAIELDDGSVIEAWQTGGVRQLDNPLVGHDPETPIDFFTVDTFYHRPRVEAFLTQQLGKAYDFKSVFRFMSRRKVKADDKWFCSELVVAAYRHAGIDLLRGEPSLFSPRDVFISPLLVYDKSINT